jgi:hypothetical protein
MPDSVCNNSAMSDEKVENVVRPPQKPVMTNSRHSGAMVVETAKYATTTPMM